MYTAVYWRYHTKREMEFDEEHEAVNFLMYGEDNGDLSSDAVLRDGEEIYSHEGLWDLWMRNKWEPMLPTVDGVVDIKKIGP